ncbi:MAG: methylmalonyl-CoA mutase, partial [Actinobacteria bacterium]
DDAPLDTLHIGPEVEERQMKRLSHVKDERDDGAVKAALATVAGDAAQPDVNLMPSILDAVRAYATVGEVVDAMADVFGRWTEDPVI